jgi:hypothetical protein
MRYWVSPNRSSGEEIDDELAQDARELKNTLLNNKEALEELRTLVAEALFEQAPDAASVILHTGHPGGAFSFNIFLNSGMATASTDFFTQFKVLLRNVLQIGKPTMAFA